VNVVLAQRLVRRLAGAKESYTLTRDEIDALGKRVNMNRLLSALTDEKIVPPGSTWDTVPFYKAKPGVETEDGYKGRIGIHEVLRMTQAIRDLALKSAPAENIEEQARKEGMFTMLEDGIFKAAMGMTTIEEVYRVVNE
jgi:type II secretory ATPase GspE/PulE/Tfp pilus assembly ATPase PilB-like protein